jgi:hypothetical protein
MEPAPLPQGAVMSTNQLCTIFSAIDPSAIDKVVLRHMCRLLDSNASRVVSSDRGVVQALMTPMLSPSALAEVDPRRPCAESCDSPVTSLFPVSPPTTRR